MKQKKKSRPRISYVASRDQFSLYYGDHFLGCINMAPRPYNPERWVEWIVRGMRETRDD